MDSKKTLAAPAYLIAFLLFALPLIDVSTQLTPFRFASEQWRFNSVGAISSMLILPIAAVLVAVATAAIFEHRRTRRIFGWISALLAIALAAALVLFVLDFFQVRPQYRPQLQDSLQRATTLVIFKQILSIFALTLIARAGLSGPKASTGKVAKSGPAAQLIPMAGSSPVE